MSINKLRAERAIRSAKRELMNGLKSFDEGDYTGALKYLQECSEYAVKAILIAYAVDYPRIHGVGRFLIENRGRFPEWFGSKIDVISEVVDTLARNRPRFRYPYEYPPEEHKAFAEGIRLKVKELFTNCDRLIDELFGEDRSR